jgi:hypothetical protein
MKPIGPGSLVMVLEAPNPAHRSHAGEIRVVGDQMPLDPRLGPAWLLNGIPRLQWTARYLRPIDSPRDDAVDEMIDLAGKAPTIERPIAARDAIDVLAHNRSRYP